MVNAEHIKQLKKIAQQLKPIVIIGSNQLSSNVHSEIETALNAHELVKIRVNAPDKMQRKQMVETICQQHQAELIQAIGHVVVIYRKSEED